METMKLLAALLIFLLNGHLFARDADKSDKDLVFNQTDKEQAERIMSQFGKDKNMDSGDLLLKVALSFLGTPYVAHTLETGKDEKMVINLRELDCTTFAENVLALTRTLKYGKQDFRSFIRELESIRYRNGARDGYLSRLHYFSEWIDDNAGKGKITDAAYQITKNPYIRKINFMSGHPQSYPVLKENPWLVEELKKQEAAVSDLKNGYIPKTDLKALEKQLKDGDIVAITTAIDGLDVTHVGIIIWREGRARLLHASSGEMKVVVTSESLEEYLLNSKSATGIMVARPL